MSTMLGDKDWVHQLEVKEYKIPNKVSRKANSIDHLVEIIGGNRPLKLFKKVFKNIEDLIDITRVVESNQSHMIINFIRQNKEILNELINDLPFTPVGVAYDIIYYYFVSKDNRCDKQVVQDYCKMLISQGMKINLNLSSFTSIKNKHDELSRYIIANSSGGEKLKVSKKFKPLKSTEEIEVEMITTSKRLDDESLALHHCVHSYKQDINTGKCAIYSIKYDNKSYTLQLSANQNSEGKTDYIIQQLKGSRNCNPPIEMRPALEKMIEDNGLVPIEHSYIYFGNKEKSKNKTIVQQIGTKVLEKIAAGEHEVSTQQYHYDLLF